MSDRPIEPPYYTLTECSVMRRSALNELARSIGIPSVHRRSHTSLAREVADAMDQARRDAGE